MTSKPGSVNRNMVEYNEDFVAETNTGSGDSWKTFSREEFEVGYTQEFGGSYDGPAPENFMAVALTNCFVATFKAVAERSDFSFENIEAEGNLKIRPENGETRLKEFELEVILESDEEDRKSEIILEKTLKNCFLLDAFEPEIKTDYVLK